MVLKTEDGIGKWICWVPFIENDIYESFVKPAFAFTCLFCWERFVLTPFVYWVKKSNSSHVLPCGWMSPCLMLALLLALSVLLLQGIYCWRFLNQNLKIMCSLHLMQFIVRKNKYKAKCVVLLYRNIVTWYTEILNTLIRYIKFGLLVELLKGKYNIIIQKLCHGYSIILLS